MALFSLNLSQCATVYFTLRFFRALGFRLIQDYPARSSRRFRNDDRLEPVNRATPREQGETNGSDVTTTTKDTKTTKG